MDGKVDLGVQLEQAVTDLVESGRFASRDDLIREGIRLVQHREAVLAGLDSAIERGLADAASGRVSPPEAVEQRLLDRIRRKTAAE